MRRLLRNIRLVDGTGAPAREGAALLIEGDTIVHAGPLSTADAPRPGDAEVMAPLPSHEQHGPADVSGRGIFTIPFGPVRSGVFESLEFLVETPGEDVPHVNIRPHFKHRGVAKRFELLDVYDGVLVAERVEGIASVAHALAFSHAVEALCGIEVPESATQPRPGRAEIVLTPGATRSGTAGSFVLRNRSLEENGATERGRCRMAPTDSASG